MAQPLKERQRIVSPEKRAKAIAKLERSRTIARLIHAGKDTKEIAAEIGCSVRCTRHYIEVLFDEISTDIKEHLDRYTAKAIARYDYLWSEAIAAWQESKKDKEVRTIEDSGDEPAADGTSGGRKKRSIRREGQCGDAALLQRAQHAQDKIVQLLGLNAPSKLAVQAEIGGGTENRLTIRGAAAAAAREIINNDPTYIDYLRQKVIASGDESRPVGDALQQRLVEDVPAPCSGGLPLDGSSGGPVQAIDDPGAAGPRQDGAN